MKMNAMLMTDFYKISHRIMSEKGTQKIYSTFTARGTRIEDIKEVVFFGLQGFIKEYLIEYFNENFFNLPKEKVVASYKRTIKYTLGDSSADSTHIEALHDLGYLPIKIMAVKEGTLIPLRVPPFTVESTNKDFFWLTQFLETLSSANTWKVITATTIVKKYRNICEEWAEKTCDSTAHIQWQCHNFSYRGMSGHEDAYTTGAGHLLYFTGTDTIPAIEYLEQYYNANIETELVGSSVLATEHSIQCGYQDDLRYFKRMITEVAPSGIISIVSDGYDYWNVIDNVLPTLKDTIMSRDGKLVIRPDSGDPVKIICGSVMDIEEDKDLTLENIKEWYKDVSREYFCDNCDSDGYIDEKIYYCRIDNKLYKVDCKASITSERGGYSDSKYYVVDGVKVYYEEIELTIEQKGSVEALWDTFGGIVNSKGYKVLDSHIGLIYGDAITTERAEEIFKQLEAKGFSSENIVFGVGSYSLGYYTRDTFMIALKSTYTIIDGEEKFIFKDPKTDTDGIKKSQRGMVAVVNGESGIYLIDGLNEMEKDATSIIDLLEDVFIDGMLYRDESLAEIRARVLK